MGGCISYCYITQPDFFHRDPTSWAIHEYGENNKNGLLTGADRNVCWLARSVHCLNRKRNCTDGWWFMLFCHAMFYRLHWISILRCRISSFLWHVGSHYMGGGLAICYIISGGLVKLLYNVIWGRGVLKNWHFLLYNMWTAPYELRSA